MIFKLLCKVLILKEYYKMALNKESCSNQNNNNIILHVIIIQLKLLTTAWRNKALNFRGTKGIFNQFFL